MKDTVYSINGPVITVRDTDSFGMMEMVYVGNAGLIGEVIHVSDDRTTIQVYENTTGLSVGAGQRHRRAAFRHTGAGHYGKYF